MAKALKIVAKKNGFRRAGRSFSDTDPTVIPVADLTKEQIATLASERMLVVHEIETEEPKRASNSDGDGQESDSSASAEASPRKGAAKAK